MRNMRRCDRPAADRTLIDDRTHTVPHAGSGPPVRRWIADLLSGFTTETTPGAAGPRP